MRFFKPIPLVLLACAVTAQAAPRPAPQQQQAASQEELKSLQENLQRLKQDLAANESHKSEAADALKEAELAISDASRTLAKLSEDRAQTMAELAELDQDIAQTRLAIEKSQARLAQLLRTRYQAGQIEAWRLLLNQQDPNRASRELMYYRYLARAQQSLAQRLADELARLNTLAEQIRAKKELLDHIVAEKEKQHQKLRSQQQQKQVLVSKLDQQISAQRNQLQKLIADEKRLTSLVDRLNAIIRKQQADRAREEAKKRSEAERLARLQQQQQKQQSVPRVSGKIASKAEKPAPTVKPETPVRTNNELPDESVTGSAFAALKGKLKLPAKGEVIGRFGTPRSEGTAWKGIFLRTSSGQPVKAVANGRVVYADWLRGFGNLIIVDHGGGYMSLYGATESLMKQVGDQVKPGDTIATTGNSGGMAETGVYFEIRQNGKPLDPLGWAAG